MLKAEDLQQVRSLIEKSLVSFKQKELSFTTRRTIDTATDKKASQPKGQAGGTYMPLSGGTFTGTVTMKDGSTFSTSGAKIGGSNVGFFGTAPIAKQTVTGAKAGNAALTSLMSALSALGLVTDSTT